MEEQRIKKHPIIAPNHAKKIDFYFENQRLTAFEGEVLSSALFAHGIHCFGKHHKDNAPQGIFCANGQCAQCLVLADGKPVKSCITTIKAGMKIEPLNGFPVLTAEDEQIIAQNVPEQEIDVLIVGAGPAGLSAAIELANFPISVVIADDKPEVGGKLSLQTHKFFGSTKDCYAGTRGVDIGNNLAEEIQKFSNVELWLEAPVVGVFVDGKVGILKENSYRLIRPKVLLVAAGARERNLIFAGSDLPGVYGAGAFQTLVNRDLIRASERLFIVGGGNVGLIAAYHALQAGIDVVGLVEALPQCGGYKVHLDKIKRLGVPVYTSHTILNAQGDGHVEKITIAEINKDFKPIPDTEKSFAVDTLLIAVGLSSVNELLVKAKLYGIKAYGAGDADIVAEASAAMFSGKITARNILQDMGFDVIIDEKWEELAEILRSRPGETKILAKAPTNVQYPNLFCIQEIPCNPCTDVCPVQSITTEGNTLMGVPSFQGKCVGCGRCIAICPGLAITLVDRRHDDTGEKVLVTLPWEMNDELLKPGDSVITTAIAGEEVGTGKVIKIKDSKWQDRTKFLVVEVAAAQADQVAGIRMPNFAPEKAKINVEEEQQQDVIICRCQRVSKQDIEKEIDNGITDINSIKARLECCMGPCGGKTCEELILNLFREKGIPVEQITPHVIRPFVQEVPLQAFLEGDKRENL